MTTYRLTIAHLYPEQMNIYGDRGNIITLRQRCAWRGIETDLVPVMPGSAIDWDAVDIAFFGGGQDSGQALIAADFVERQAAPLHLARFGDLQRRRRWRTSGPQSGRPGVARVLDRARPPVAHMEVPRHREQPRAEVRVRAQHPHLPYEPQEGFVEEILRHSPMAAQAEEEAEYARPVLVVDGVERLRVPCAKPCDKCFLVFRPHRVHNADSRPA